MIEQNISDSGIGLKRKVRFEGINFMSQQRGYAEIVFHVFLYDNEGNLITTPDVQQGRAIISPISNENMVNPETGVTLQSGQDGAPEFNWWWTLAQTTPLPVLIQQAITILDQEGRFDRE